MTDPPAMQEMRVLEARFLASSFWKSVKPRLATLNTRVDNIECAGFGNAYEGPDANGELNAHRITQHLFACAISNFLSQHYAAKDAQQQQRKAIPIVAYDPVYTMSSMHMLSHLSLPIDIVSAPHHFLAITPNTIVLTIHMPNFEAFHEVVADVCYPDVPAAIFKTRFSSIRITRKDLYCGKTSGPLAWAKCWRSTIILGLAILLRRRRSHGI